MKWLLALLPVVAAVPMPDTPTMGDAPAPGQVTIKGLTYGGTGCPQGSVGSAVSEDQSIMTLIFDSYEASIGPGVAKTENRKNCQLNVNLLYPGGFQYSILSADYRGYASVDQGVTGTLKSTYYFSGSTSQTITSYSFQGPVVGANYLKHDQADSTSIVWSPCGANGLLNVNSQVQLTSNNASATGLLTTDSIDLSFKTVVYIQWRTCTSKST